MRSNRFILGAALAVPLALAGCGGDGGSFELELVHVECKDGVDFLSPGVVLDISILEGDRVLASVEQVAVSKGSVEIPEVPFGKNRVARVLARNPGNNLVVALGRSAPFEVSESEKTRARVLMLPANEFARAANAENVCQELSTPRAGHTAVALRDGRVLLVGGYSAVEGGMKTGFLATAEMYDPVKGVFQPIAAPCSGGRCYDGAHGAGVLLNDGRALIVGGESFRDGQVVAIPTAAIYDPSTGAWTVLEMNSARRGHTVTRFPNASRVLVAGGENERGEILDTTEVFEGSSFAAGPKIPANVDPSRNGAGRAWHGAVATDSMIALVGGIDGEGKFAPGLAFFNASMGGGSTGANRMGSRAVDLPDPVAEAGVVLVNGAVAVVGGYGEDGRDRRGVQWTKLPDAPAQFDANFARTAPCVVDLDGRRSLVVGGFRNGTPTEEAELILWDDVKSPPGVASSLLGALAPTAGASKSRVAHAHGTCTNLGDGRVLVTGGVDASGRAVGVAEIYTARPIGN